MLTTDERIKEIEERLPLNQVNWAYSDIPFLLALVKVQRKALARIASINIADTPINGVANKMNLIAYNALNWQEGV